MTGKQKGEITKSGKKGNGTPWSEVWGREMKKCTGPGSWLTDGMGEAQVEEEGADGLEVEPDVEEVEEGEKDEDDHRIRRSVWGRYDKRNDESGGRYLEKMGKPGSGGGIACSPVTVIYGHAGKISLFLLGHNL